MMTVITGGSKSGKSRMAEKIAEASGLDVYYIATMTPFGEDAEKIIERHRKMREKKGFITLEKYREIENAKISEGSCAILEDVGNLLANEMFSEEGTYGAEKIAKGIDTLGKKAENLIVVTNEVFGDGFEYPDETARYISLLGEINRRIAEKADTVIEAVFNIALVLKGERPKCL